MHTRFTLKDVGPRPENLPGESWKMIPGSDDRYMVSTLGRLMTLNYKMTGQARIMKPAKDGNGYLRTMIWLNGKTSTIKLHRIVAITFLPNPEHLEEVNHINFDRTDNRVVNLEWVSRAQNLKHTLDAGRATMNNGPKNGMAKLTTEQVIEIRAKFKPYVYMMKDLAVEYGVSKATIKDVLHRHWRHVK